MFLSDVSIKRPVFTAMVTIGLMTLGLISAGRIGVDLFPDVAFPVVVVTTVYPGAGPEEIEREVSKPIEEVVSSINGIDRVRSFSRDSVSIVMAEFKLETDVKAAATDVRERMAILRPKLPDDIQEPLIQRFDPASMPIMTYVVSSNRHPSETRELSEDVVKPLIEAVDGVASVTVVGGLEREVKVRLRRDRLEALGLPISQVAQNLGMEGFDLPAGRVENATTELSVKTEGRFRSLDELRNLVVASLGDGAQVRLQDIADVESGFKDVRIKPLLDGKDAVALEIQKQSGTNTVAVADHVYKAIAKAEKVLPADVKLLKTVDGSVFIRRNIDDVKHEIIFGGLMAILVIFLFMLDWRSTLISSLSLPTSVVTTFLVMWYMGFTFNMMSLLGLSLSIGLLIDDAVVVRENIFRHMEMGKDRVTASRDGTNEIGLAVMATTFTIVAVFVPVGFMGGMVGKMFKEFGLTVAAAVLVSLFVSFTLDPMMSANVMKPIEPGHHHKLKKHRIFGPIVRFYDSMDTFYRNVLAWALGHKKTVVALAALLFVGSMMLTKFMGTEFVSLQDRGEFKVALETPAGSSIAWTETVTREAEAAVRRASPHVKSLYTTIAPGENANKATIRVYATKAVDRRPVTQWDIEGAVRKELAAIPNIKFAVSDLGLIEGGEESPIALALVGDDYGALEGYAKQVLAAIEKVPGVADPDMSFRSGKPETSIRVDRNKAADLGVSVGVIGQTLRLAVEGNVVAKLSDPREDIDIRLQLAPDDRATVEDLGALTVPATLRRMGGQGRPMTQAQQMAAQMPRYVPIRDVADVVSGSGPSTIERENRRRQIMITANLDGRSLGDVVKDVEAKLAAIQAPPGVAYRFSGQTERMQETFANMGLALGVAILFIFFVLASQFESIIHPFTIMVALPLAIVGAFLALFLAGANIGMASMIGVILLMGLVTKNAILLIDYANELRGHGKGMIDALLEAGPTRLRPILMTSAAMVLGMMPSAMSKAEGSEFRSPMAIAVIGGVIASTFLTLLVVPVVYTWMDRFTSRGRAEAKERKQQRSSSKAPSTQHAPEPEVAAGALRAAGEDA